MYNLMRRAAADFDQVLVAFTENLDAPPPEVLDICAEVVLVHRAGSHSLPVHRPARKWWKSSIRRPSTRRCARPCASGGPPWRSWSSPTWRSTRPIARPPAPSWWSTTLLSISTSNCCAPGTAWELRRQTAALAAASKPTPGARWTAWSPCPRRTASLVTGARAVRLAERRGPGSLPPRGRGPPEPRRLLFIGSFAHLPNLHGASIFSWPRCGRCSAAPRCTSSPARATSTSLTATATVSSSGLPSPASSSKVSSRTCAPAYERAALVVAPLVASAGTNIKILEAMAMGKAIVSTPAGVNGLDLVPGGDFLLRAPRRGDGRRHRDPFRRSASPPRIESAARARVERDFGWDAIVGQQVELYGAG